MLVGVARVQVPQRFILGKGMHRGADRSRDAGDRLLERRRALTFRRKGLLETFELLFNMRSIIRSEARCPFR